MTTVLFSKSQFWPPWQGEAPLRDSRTAFGFDLELLLMPGKMETLQFTTYAKEAYYFDDDNFVCKSQIRPPWQGERPIRDSRTAFGFHLELLLMPGKMETVQCTTYAKEAYYFNGDNSVYKSQIRPPWQREGPLRDSRTAFGFDLELFLMPGKMETLQFTTYAKEAYYFNGDNSVSISQIRPPWQGEGPLRDSRTAFGFDLELLLMPGKMETVQCTTYAKEAYYFNGDNSVSKSQIRPPWQEEGPLRDSRTDFRFDLELLLLPGKMETVQFTTYAKEAYYFDDDNFVFKSQIRPPWQGKRPIRDSRTAFGFDLELLLMPEKMETVQFTTYAKEAYYFDDDNFVCKSQIRPPWQGERPIRDSRTAFGFDLELLLMPGKMETVQCTTYAKEAYYFNGDNSVYKSQIRPPWQREGPLRDSRTAFGFDLELFLMPGKMETLQFTTYAKEA